MQELLRKLVDESHPIFGRNLVGIYLHGSMAMGCFHPSNSDLDIIFVVENSVTSLQKKQLMQVIVDLNAKASAKGIEMSLVKREYCKHFVYPTPFELHFSNTHLHWYQRNPSEFIEKMNGLDYDLAAHFVITRSRGIVLYGKPILEVFGEIPSEAYKDSIQRDIAHADAEVIENPIYIILNLCRVLAYFQDGLVLSKKEGGQWGRENIAVKYEGLITEALVCYSSDQNMQVKHALAIEFCRYMKDRLGLIE